MTGEEPGVLRRTTRTAGLALLLVGLVCLSPAARSSPASLSEALAARFPAIRTRLESPVRLETASWQEGSRHVAGFRAVLPSPSAEPASRVTTDASAATERPAVDRVRVSFPTVATDALVAEGEGVRVVLAARGARAARAEAEGAAVAYRNVYAQTDALHVVKPDWTEEYLYLRTPDAPRRFEYEIVEAAGATRTLLDDGQVHFLDDSGRGLVVLAPVVVDAAGRRSATAARWSLETGGDTGRLTLDLDTGGLDYPLLVDPTWITTGSLNTARGQGIGLLLHNGKVLVMAGAPNTQDTSELYDPATGIWTPAGSIGEGHALAAAVVLRDGRALLTGGSNSGGFTAICRIFDPQTNSWTAAASMGSPRRDHTATLLTDGRVLVSGGQNVANNPIATAEIYDPGTNTWTPTGNMVNAHRSHAAARLPDGKVLVAGGVTLPGPTITMVSEVFDPGTGVWTRVGDMGTFRHGHSGTVLPDGTVLVAGGLFGVATGTAETFNPATGLWTATGPLISGRGRHTSTLLPSGRVVVAGGADVGILSSTEFYDPGTGLWSVGPSMSIGRLEHAGTMLPDGRVLAVGGFNGPALATAELLDVDAPSWAAATPMAIVRSEATATVLKSGKVLVTGGVGLDTAQVYDPAVGNWTPTPNLSAQRWRHTATALVDGRVLVAGGSGSPTGTAELYDPLGNTWLATGSMAGSRGEHTATLLPCGEVLVAGGSSSVATAERYSPATGLWRATGSMNLGRFRHTATLLKDGRVLVTGGWNAGSPSPTAEVYDPTTGMWTSLVSTMSAGRYHHQATLLPSGKVLITAGSFASASADLFDPTTDTFAATGALTFAHNVYFTATLLPNGRVLAVGGSANPRKAEVYDPVVGVWTAVPDTLNDRRRHVAALLPDGGVLLAGGVLEASAELYDVGRGENVAWRPLLTNVTDPLLTGTPLTVQGANMEGLGEGSTGLGYMHSATNYPLVQLRRLDNEQVSWLLTEPTVGWSGVSFGSLPVTDVPPGLAIATVFTNGIPSESMGLSVQCPPPSITVPPASASVCVGGSTAFTVTADAPASSCPSYQWRKGGTPLAEAPPFSGTTSTTLTVTGAGLVDAGSYDVEVSLACSTTVATSAAATLTVNSAIGAVDASISGPASVCTTCLGGNASESHAGGGAVTHQWGYRTISAGAITDIPFATSPTYVLNGTDFPAEGNYFLVVKVTATCGGLVISDEVPVTIANTPGPADEVPFFTVTSRSTRNVLEWVYPAGFNGVRIRFTTGLPCVFPTDPLTSGTLLVDQVGTAGNPDKYAHDPVLNTTTYCYTVFVDTGGSWSTGHTNSARPIGPWASNIVWSFSSGMFSTTAPTVGGAGVIATNNANAVHAMARDVSGGEWPPGWKPVMLGGAVQNRSPVIPITVGGANPVVLLGAQDGFVYAVNGTTGSAGVAPWAGPAPMGGLVQAAPAGLFSDFGGAFDYVLVGTREAAADNVFRALDPADGSLIETFDNGGAGSGIGIISGMATVDYGTSRVYFTSRARTGGSANTLWCLQLGMTPSVFTLAWARDNLGDIESAPVLRGGRVYVGSTNSGGTLYSIDAAGGLPVNDRTFVHGDGAVKGFVFPDRNSPTGDLYFAAGTRVWGVTEMGGVLANKFSSGISLFGGATPSTLLFLPGSQYLFAGGNDGGLYQIDILGGPAVVLVDLLGTGPLTVGAPSFDREHGMLHVGTEEGVFHALPVPTLFPACVRDCAGQPDGQACTSTDTLPCLESCVAGTCF